jgi:hypothetical protein
LDQRIEHSDRLDSKGPACFFLRQVNEIVRGDSDEKDCTEAPFL